MAVATQRRFSRVAVPHRTIAGEWKMRDPFDVLGVSPGATRDEVDRAYRSLAQIYHPDRYSMMSDQVRQEAETRMKDLNEAYSAIKAGTARATPEESAAERAVHEAVRRAQAFQGSFCLICGYGPAVQVRLRSGVGMILSRRVQTWEGDLCRDCGVALFRESQNATLIKGWWGYISFFVNWLYLFGNLGARAKLGRLAAPRPTPMSVLAPAQHPLATGSPLYLRAGVWFAIVLFAIVGSIAGQSSSSQSPSTNIPTTTLTPSDSVGDCGYVTGQYIGKTTCTSYTATLRIAARVLSEYSCPSNTLYTTSSGGLTNCWVPR